MFFINAFVAVDPVADAPNLRVPALVSVQEDNTVVLDIAAASSDIDAGEARLPNSPPYFGADSFQTLAAGGSIRGDEDARSFASLAFGVQVRVRVGSRGDARGRSAETEEGHPRVACFSEMFSFLDSSTNVGPAILVFFAQIPLKFAIPHLNSTGGIFPSGFLSFGEFFPTGDLPSRPQLAYTTAVLLCAFQ